jgi:hypothetical protein
MNSYFSAIQQATSNGRFPEYSDLWRSFHATAHMMDSDYCLFTQKSPGMLTTKEEACTGRGLQKILYVPVTRKVSPTTGKNASNLY